MQVVFLRGWRPSFDEHFADELSHLAELWHDGIIKEFRGQQIRLTYRLGRLLLRMAASVFDAYLPRDAFQKGQAPMRASKVG